MEDSPEEFDDVGPLLTSHDRVVLPEESLLVSFVDVVASNSLKVSQFLSDII